MNSTPRPDTIPIILFSGMGADASIFWLQRRKFKRLTVPDWPVPQQGEDLDSYCQRLAKLIDPGEPCFVGGASFGGIAAMHVARHLEAKACFLIGSVRSPSQLPLRIRMFRPLLFLLRWFPIGLIQWTVSLLPRFARRLIGPHLSGIAWQFSRANPDVLRWSARQVFAWKSESLDVPVLAIHGSRDVIFPLRCVTPDEVVQGGGHVISVTHADKVNDFLQRQIVDSITKS